MSQDLPELLSAEMEDELALERIPPSRIDLGRACQDGYRSRRNRQARATATGVGAVGLCAVLAAVLLPHTSGGTQNSAASGVSTSTPVSSGTASTLSASAPTTAVSGSLSYVVTVPASFGWLPENVDYIITGPPASGLSGSGASTGASVFSARASGYLPGSTSAPSAGQASVYLTLSGTETTAGSSLKLDRVDGPKIGGAQSYWITKTPGDETNGGDPTLEWQTASGQWAEVDASDMGDDPMLATVEHIAETVHVGVTALPLPVQIKDLPASFAISQVVLAEPAHATNSEDWQLFTSYTLSPSKGSARGIAYVVAQGTGVGSLTGVGGGGAGSASDCKTTGDIVSCATTTYSGGTAADALPTDVQLLGNVTLFGDDQSSWSPDLLVQ